MRIMVRQGTTPRLMTLSRMKLRFLRRTSSSGKMNPIRIALCLRALLLKGMFVPGAFRDDLGQEMPFAYVDKYRRGVLNGYSVSRPDVLPEVNQNIIQFETKAEAIDDTMLWTGSPEELDWYITFVAEIMACNTDSQAAYGQGHEQYALQCFAYRSIGNNRCEYNHCFQLDCQRLQGIDERQARFGSWKRADLWGQVHSEHHR